MPTSTWIALGNITLTANDSSIEFVSIPATYRDLVLIINGTSDSAGRAFYIRLNGENPDTNTSAVLVNNANSSTDTGTYIQTNTSNFTSIVNIMDYSATDKHKTMLWRDNFASTQVTMAAGRWASMAAVNSVTISRAGYNLQNNTTLCLYGIVS